MQTYADMLEHARIDTSLLPREERIRLARGLVLPLLVHIAETVQAEDGLRGGETFATLQEMFDGIDTALMKAA
ncbi:hypothetical protein [Sagittula salina]|uniref:Uncharacterized protein n=1 Tax=Sagittula salina TaxID=2820268 RepID=A0A940MQC3_9RHOB|nr:hypothetical protein [Sagittula salina]MBP0482836.1 hypothetical protein [Sagittula salina]